MSDPRELGLPPADGAPSFRSGPDVLTEVRRRHTRRRQRRISVVGGGLVAVAVAVAFAINPGAANDALEQNQPAHSGPVASEAATPAPQPSTSVDLPMPPAPAPADEQPVPAAVPVPAPNATAAGQHRPAPPPTSDSSAVRRDRTTLGNEICRQPLDGWGTTGWCFVADEPTQATAGHTLTLSLSLCRNGSGPGQVRFPKQQQAAWDVAQGHTHFWTSNEQASPFAAGEVVTLQPKECLRWRVDWHVTTHGRAMPTGDYLLQWNTGADLRDPSGHGYHDANNIHVGPGSSSNGIAPGLLRAGALTRMPDRSGGGGRESNPPATDAAAHRF